MTTNQQDRGDLGISLGELTGIVRRRFWWFAVPAGLGALLGLILAVAWPAEYEAAAIVMIEPQGVHEDLVSSTVSAGTEARYGQIKLQILARDNLSSIIDEFGLYADEQSTTLREELVERMRGSTTIEPLPPAIVDPRKLVEIESFRIAFAGRDPAVVAQVANRLTRDFLSINLRERTSQAEGTSEFIDAELVKTEERRARLLQELMAYREENQGSLPQDLALNQRRLDRLEELQGTRRSELLSAERQVAEIHKQIQQLRTQGTDESHDPVARKRELELMLNAHRAQGKTDKHPDVVVAQTEIKALDEMLALEFETDAPRSPRESGMRSELRNYEVRASVVRSQLQDLEQQYAEIREAIAKTPSRTAQVSQLEANVVGLNTQIIDLQHKKIQADLGQSVELVQKGEKFRVVESAVPPISPVFPNRLLFFVVGTVLGVGLGMLLLVVREASDTSFKSVNELQTALELPVLGTISVIQLPAEIAKARARLRRFALAGVTALALAAGGGLLFYLFTSFTGGEETAKLERAPVADQVSHV